MSRYLLFALLVCASCFAQSDNSMVLDVEMEDFGLHPLLRKRRDSIQRVVSGHLHKWYDFANTFGPPHWVMGATRYDEDAYMLVEVDRTKQTHRILNIEEIDWSTHYSRPYRPHAVKT